MIFRETESPRSVIIHKTAFMRMSVKDVHVPHATHTDATMNTHTLLLYLNKKYPESYGTEILVHKSGMRIHPQNEDEIKLWEKDTNNDDAWNTIGFCPGRFNRAFILRSELFHRASPTGGFGNDIESGRLVLTLFFNVEK